MEGDVSMSQEMLSSLRERMLPMLQITADQYRDRVPEGYPNVVDQVDRGVIGLEIDSSHALFITTDGTDVFAELYGRNSRNDNRSSARWEKFAATPINDQRPLAADVSDQDLRNLVAELMSRFNSQHGMVHMSEQ